MVRMAALGCGKWGQAPIVLEGILGKRGELAQEAPCWGLTSY